MTRENTIEAVKDSKGNVIPGLFAFDSLPRDPAIEAEIREFTINAERQEALNNLEANLKK